MKFVALFFFTFLSTLSQAIILKPYTLSLKLAENSGSGVYVLEQEVSFTSDSEPIVIKELWFIESSKKMKLIVTPVKGFSENFKWVFIYDNGQRVFLNQQGTKEAKKVSFEFYEKYFHLRKAIDVQNAIVLTKAIPQKLFTKFPFKHPNEMDYLNDSHIQLSRLGGVVTYVFGKNNSENETDNSFFYIEQDQFTFRKIKIGSSELLADQFAAYPRGLFYPRSKTIKWDDKLVHLQTQSVSARSDKSISLQLETSSSLELKKFGQQYSMVEEFYSRFR